MSRIQEFLKSLSGKRTYIGTLLLSLLSVIYFTDVMVDDQATWLSEATYLALGGLITAATGATLRAGIKKAEKAANGKDELVQELKRKLLDQE